MNKAPWDENGDYCPACLCELKSWHDLTPECETCEAEVYQPLTREEMLVERREKAALYWFEINNEK